MTLTENPNRSRSPRAKATGENRANETDAVTPPRRQKIAGSRKGIDAKAEGERAARRDLVAILYLNALPLREIAAQVRVSTATVLRDLEVIRGEWRESYAEHFDQHVSRELALLRLVDRPMISKALEGDVDAYSAVIRGSVHRARLLGLYTTKIQVSTSSEYVETDWDRTVRDLFERHRKATAVENATSVVESPQRMLHSGPVIDVEPIEAEELDPVTDGPSAVPPPKPTTEKPLMRVTGPDRVNLDDIMARHRG